MGKLSKTASRGYMPENNCCLLFSGVQLQKKWKNIRDSYFRELRRLKNIRRRAAAPKNYLYIYFHQLRFHKVAAESIQSASNIEHPTEPEAAENLDTQSSQTYRPRQKETHTEDYIGLEIVNILKSSLQSGKESERHDSDKLFLLSLVDDFKKMPDYSKGGAKIEMINLIHSYQPQPVFFAYHSQNEIYPNTRTAFDNAAAPHLISPSTTWSLFCLVSGQAANIRPLLRAFCSISRNSVTGFRLCGVI
jgi:hypothetical protein